MFRFLAATVFFASLGLAQIHVPTAQAIAAAESKPQPEYSALARQMKVTGDVSVEVSITADGTVDDVRVVAGSPLLSPPVVKAVKAWRFKPFLQAGNPTKARTVLRFTFK